ncbi:PREDICTED: mitochondrial Rho GTPase 1-like isoform X1 [Ipomoea nil]|uniref:mitochondrial Rho GTPase 1-like isoform X1 n=1 Tax=Ipomoea nil TaxID=35883 RepID=UPI0009015699|nr:PREDICTED: mitochondrial Rho GTPase 1-like isoform X1 [Ipomoea nil]XP_019197483.1 PREDICTED: mitochondrial Rho GTPase 1-like isoform X1 [Ipomoea nil]
MPGTSTSGGRTNVRVVVVGDRATGKSSLIAAAASESFPEDLPPVLPPTRLPADLYPENVPVTIIDTSSSLESRGKLAEELKRADSVVLTYACDQPATLNRLSTFWLHEFRRLEIKAPVVVVGCKLDKRDEEHHMNLEQAMAPIMQQFREIETCIECSAANLVQVPEVFYYAQKAVLHPTAPLFDHEIQALKPRCVRALKRIFSLCDHDEDGALNDEELNDFQVKCFNAALQPAEIVGVKRVVQEKLPAGVNDLGLTLTGFLFLHALFIEKGRLETTWTVLRKFGYNDEIKLRDDYLSIPFKKALDQSMELTSEAVEFLKGIFSTFDDDKDGVLRNSELDDLFSTAPESPWEETPYKEAVERTPLGGLSLSAFLSEWALMTLLEPSQSLANLTYIGYNCDSASALCVTRRRSVDRKKQQSDRNVYQCFVFGPKYAGKSSLLKSFLGRPFTDDYVPTSEERYVVNAVDCPGGIKKTLVLREIPEDGIKKLLSTKESLASCDIAVFVYDSSDEYSLKRTSELLMDVARQGEVTGLSVPCLFIAAKDDLDTYPMAIKDSTKIFQYFGIDSPIHISVKERDLNSVFSRIVNAAEHPHLSVPETEVGRNQKRYRQLINRSLMVASVAAAIGVVGMAAYRSYIARKNTSG